MPDTDTKVIFVGTIIRDPIEDPKGCVWAWFGCQGRDGIRVHIVGTTKKLLLFAEGDRAVIEGSLRFIDTDSQGPYIRVIVDSICDVPDPRWPPAEIEPRAPH